MNIGALRKQAFSAWIVLMCELPEEDSIPLVGQTLAIVLQYWEKLHQDTKEEVKHMLTLLFDQYPKQLAENAYTLPSLAPISLLARQEVKLRRWRERNTVRGRFWGFAERCKKENGAVVEQALAELSLYLQSEQAYIQTTATSEQPDVVVADLVRSLLDVCVHHKDSQNNISRLAAECLGIIGAVDPSKVEANRARKQSTALNNLETAEEAINFIQFLLEELLVKAFLATVDTREQGFLAHAIQELLKFCDLDVSVLSVRRTPQNAAVLRWRKFSEGSRSILMPFLNSKYVLSGKIPIIPAPKYPIFTPAHKYRSWLLEFLFDLMAKVQGNNASYIFIIVSRIVKQDLSIASFILPYVTLNVVISGTDKDRQQLAQELLAIVGRSDPLVSGTLKQCSEVCCV